MSSDDLTGISLHKADSGLRNRAIRVEVTTDPLVSTEYRRLVTTPAVGAVVAFEGIVRDHDHGRKVRELEYVGHPTASIVLSDVVHHVIHRHPDIECIAVGHRLGILSIGETALLCAVSAHHRAAAFAACLDLVEEIKSKIPVWKRQVYADGTENWVNCD